MEQRTNPACVICEATARSSGTKGEYTYYRCQSCKHFFVWPMPTPAALAEIYREDYFSGAGDGFGYVDYDRDKMPMIPTFEKYLDVIAKYGPHSGRMLDIGAATGFFLDLARNRGWTVHGVEPSDYAASLGRSKGIPVVTGTLDQLPPGLEKFDVVTMWDVIEHLTEPEEALRSVHGFLKPGGLLVINTPDSGSLMAKVLGTKWHLVVPPEHLNLFHRKSLRFLLEKNGFDLLLDTTVGKQFTPQYIFQTLAHWQKLSIWQKLSDGLKGHAINRLAIPINLRDNMFVLAKARAA